jgi:hypothetical protein
LAVVQGDGRANQLFQRRRIDGVAVVQVNTTARLGFQAGVEKPKGILQRRTPEKVDFDVIPEGPNRHNISVPRPYGRAPFPLFDCVRSGFADQCSELSQHAAAPISKAVNVFRNLFGCVHGKCFPTAS